MKADAAVVIRLESVAFIGGTVAGCTGGMVEIACCCCHYCRIWHSINESDAALTEVPMVMPVYGFIMTGVTPRTRT